MKLAKIVPFFILLQISINANSQSGFVKGYYITASQDTIHGYIQGATEQRNLKVCIFRNGPDESATKFYPKDIAGYVIESGKYYESRTFKDKDGEDLTLFFEVVERGKLSLLKVYSRYFAETTKNELFEITKGNKLAMGALTTLMADCEQLPPEILEHLYKFSYDLKKLFKTYNNCVGSSVTLVTQEEKAAKPFFEYGLQASATTNDIKIESSFGTANFKDNSFNFGGYVAFFPGKINKHSRIVMEAYYEQIAGQDFFNLTSTTSDVFIKYSTLKTPMLFRLGGKTLFVDLGIQNQFVLTQDLKWRKEDVTGNIVRTSYEDVQPLSTYSMSYLFGAGAKFTVMDRTIMTSLRYCGSPKSGSSSNIELKLFFQLTR